MRFSLTRRGGFAGIRLPPVVVDTAHLPPAAAGELKRLVATTALRVKASPPRPADAPAQADRFSYTVEITDDDGKTHTLAFDEATATPSLNALVLALQRAHQK